jgi:hypothetical protein
LSVPACVNLAAREPPLPMPPLPMTTGQIHVPRPSDEGRMTSFVWLPIRCRCVIAALNNPLCAGVHVCSQSERWTAFIDAQTRRSYGLRPSRSDPGR